MPSIESETWLTPQVDETVTAAPRVSRPTITKRSGKKITLAALFFLGATLLSSGVTASEVNPDEYDPQAPQNWSKSAFETQGHDGVKKDKTPISEAQAQKKQNLETQYGGGHLDVEIFSIQPEAGPITGETRIIVRGSPFKDMDLIYPHPKCKFGSWDKIVSATYVSCTEAPLSIHQAEGHKKQRQDICLQCENSPVWEQPEIIPFSISLTGDFTDSKDSEPYRYFAPTKVHAIYPRYGPKDGQTFVQVWGQNFLNFDENTRCNFGSKSVDSYFLNQGYITCRAAESDVVDKPIPFSVSLNNQQNSRDRVDYWYYNNPTVSQLVPNYGPDAGGNEMMLKGSNFDPFKESIDMIQNNNDTFCNFESLGKMPLRVINSTRAYCEVPPNIYGLDMTVVEITLNNQNYTDDNVIYYFYRPPKIYSIDNGQGPTQGGTEITIFGDEFKKGKDIVCIFGNNQDKKVPAEFISTTQIKCVSPKWDHPGKQDLMITYEGDGDKFVSEAAEFLYYEQPIIASIDPECGPTLGYTQITVKGKNFVDMGFGMAKCVFNNTVHMNTTIVNDETLLCSTPPLTVHQASLPPEEMFFTVDITLNGVQQTEGSKVAFYYYPEPRIQTVQSAAWGPVSGGTESQLIGHGFAHPNMFNLNVRYGALVVKPTHVNDTYMETVSPRVSVPDRVVVTASGNGQNWAGDKILHYRDDGSGSNWQGGNNNMYIRDDHVIFTYIQDAFVHSMHPQMGPTSGNTKIVVQGFGFQQFKYDNGTMKEQPIYVRYRDMDGNAIGEPSEAKIIDNDEFTWTTPAASLGTKAVMSISFNDQQWQQIIPSTKDFSFLYYDAPQVTSIEPHFGPVKSKNTQRATIYGKNFECPHGDCSKLTVRFGDAEHGTYVPGRLVSSDAIEVEVPKYPKPDVLDVEVSFNGQDYSSNHVNYGFFDPYVLRVTPRLISPKGTTKVTISGFGFVNSDQDDIKAKFGQIDSEVSCSAIAPCKEKATFVDKNTILADTFPASEVHTNAGHLIGNDPLTVEVSVYGDVFTENHIQVWYYSELEFQSINRRAVARNLPEPLVIRTNFHWKNNDVQHFYKHANLTCRFTMDNHVAYTDARMESLPLGSLYSEAALPDAIICPSPKVDFFGKGKLDISVNGQDYNGNFDFEITDPVDLYRIQPQSGPREGNTRVKLIGNGFSSANQDIYPKFGNIDALKIRKDQVLSFGWSEADYLNSLFMTTSDLDNFHAKNHKLEKGQTVVSTYTNSPAAPNAAVNPTMGGPVYVSVGENYNFNVTDDYQKQDYIYSNSLVEFYYYKNPVVKKVEPLSGLTTGGTKVELSGAWFDYKLEYGVIPMCKIGDKITRGIFISTVRIVCHAPPNENTFLAMPVKVSLNGVDWVDTGFKFSYYIQPTVYDMTPKSGHMAGGNEIFIFGDKFSNITDPLQVQCRFTYIGDDKQVPEKRVPAYYVNETTMSCNATSGFVGGDKTHVQLTFNGNDFTAENENLIYTFYNVFGSFPRSGPADSYDESILVKGAGFKTTAHVMCSLNRTTVPALEVSPNLIRCPMALSSKDASVTGNIKFGISIDGSWTDFGNFYYYDQITLNDMQPRVGPAEGEGIIYFYGKDFRDNFVNVEIGCKIGESIGQGELIDAGTIRCTIEEMELVNEGETLPSYLALNSYSWVGGSAGPIGFVPYGVTGVYPNSGPYTGYTDILITGKGFSDDMAERAKCRFGVDTNYVSVDAEVLDYNKMICRSPENFKVPSSSDETISVPIGIGFLEEEFRPWTEDLHRFSFYVQPEVAYADPDEVHIGKMVEIYVWADDDSVFFEPVPDLVKSQMGQYGIVCSFEDFGTSMGMYVNETTVLCVSPHIPGQPDDYYQENVQVAIAMNGQDFNDMHSDAEVLFIGTGSNMKLIHFILGTLLVGLLILSILTCCAALFHTQSPKPLKGPNVVILRDDAGSISRANAGGYDIRDDGRTSAFRGSSAWRAGPSRYN